MMKPQMKSCKLKKSICISLLSCFAFFSKAQEIYLSGAFNACNITAYGSSSFQKPGGYFSFGKSQIIERSPGWRFNYGIAFNQKGARKVPDPKNFDFTEYNVRLNYVEVPLCLMLKMKTLYGLVGLNAGYLVHSYERSLNGSPVFNSGFRKMDFSGSLGAGIFAGKSVFFSLQASYSLLPIRELAGTGTVGFARAPRNSLFSIGITYLLFKKEKPEEAEEPSE